MKKTDLHQAALQYANPGLPVFPCGGNKRPKLPPDKDANGKLIPRTGGLNKATCALRQIEQWWTQWPSAMIGMVTGERSGVHVLDIDCKNADGFAELPDWEERSPVIIRTPSGGAHLWFKADQPLRNSAGKIAGIDVRGDGGYVIVPPSPGYRW